ncbi:MAG TPA: glycosyltransferase family 4 protein [Stellaceae bacterium]
MKVALATDWFLPRLGGIELHLADLARALIARGVEVGILTTTPGPDFSDGLAVRRLQPLRLPMVDLAISPRLVDLLKREFVAGGYDVVHAHISVISPVGFGAVLAAHALNLPTVVTFAGVLLRSAQFLRLADRMLGWSRWPIIVTAVSGIIAEQLRAVAPSIEVTVLPNGVDGAFWRAAASAPKPPGDGILAVSAMRLTRKKRPAALLHAFARARMAPAPRGRPFHLTIAGAGPLRGRLEKFVAAEGLRDHVTFLGAVPRQTLADLYRRADFFVLPSIHESFGIAALEARSAGLPVLGMKRAGIGEFLRDGETAMLAADDAEFARYLERLASDVVLRLRLARADPDLARFEWPNVAQAHLECFEQAIALARG